MRKLVIDLSPLRESRDFRLLELGTFLSGMGTQMALVALPYQTFVVTRSPFLTGLLGAVELAPLVTFSLYGGAIADRLDRRRLLLGTQAALVVVASVLAIGAFAHTRQVWFLYVMAGLLAGFGAFESVARMSIIPNVVRGERLRSALSFNFGALQLQTVVGPAAGGLVIAAFGIGTAYLVDAITCAALVAAVSAMTPQPPPPTEHPHPPVLQSVAEGLRFVRGEQALLGSFAIDLVAMTFGMPRALFPVLSLSVYHAGASGTGFLFAAVSAGATLAALTAGGDWLAAQLDYLRGNRDLVERRIGLPMAHVEATFLAWIDCSRLRVTDPHAHFLAHGVALSPGAQFGDARYVRLNFGTQRSRLEEALRRIRSASTPSPKG
jgi:MFS family permease